MDIAIQMQNVTYKKKQQTLLYDINLEAYRGEILGILGANGSGKTTLIRVLTGQIPQVSGTIMINGENCSRDRVNAMASTGCILEGCNFFPYLTGMQNLRIYAGMHPDITAEHLTNIITLVNLTRCIQHRVSTYSNGMLQRLAIAQALLHQPDVLLLDEPWAGLDPAGVRTLCSYLRMLARKKHVCILIATNRLSEAELVCDRVVMLAGGRITAVHSMQELMHTAGGTHTIYRFRLSDAQEAQIAARLVLETDMTVCDKHILELSIPNHDTDNLLSRLVYQFVAWGIDIYTIYPIDNRKLEDAFFEIT